MRLRWHAAVDGPGGCRPPGLPAAMSRKRRIATAVRVAQNGKAYTEAEFLRFYSAERGAVMWDCALPPELTAATLKYIVVSRAYQALVEGLESEAVAAFRQRSGAAPERCRPPPEAATTGARGEAEAASAEAEDSWTKPCTQCGRAAWAAGRGRFAGTYWCDECWNSWLEVPRWQRESITSVDADASGNAAEGQPPEPSEPEGVALPEPSEPEGVVLPASALVAEPSNWWRHFDYVEVGTSDWGTLTQYCADNHSDQGSWLAGEIRTSLPSMYCARGLAVEAVAEYLDALPQLPLVTRVNAAMGEKGGQDTLFFVSAENAERLMGRYRASMYGDSGQKVDVMWFAKSLSSVGKPHPDLVAMLQQIGRQDLLERRPISMLSWGDLCMQHGLGSVDVVQLDCEGMDCAILRGLMAYCDVYPRAYPRVIQFEANYLTAAQEIDETVAALCARGYKVRTRGHANITVER